MLFRHFFPASFNRKLSLNDTKLTETWNHKIRQNCKKRACKYTFYWRYHICLVEMFDTWFLERLYRGYTEVIQRQKQ